MVSCKECGKEFSERRQLEQHYEAKHRAAPEPVVERKSKRVYIVGTVSIALMIVAVSIFALSSGEDVPRDPSDNYFVDESEIPRGFVHYHPKLQVIIHGEERVIPANLGLGQVHLPVHTHDTTGELHYETSRPSVKVSTLGYFVNEVWGVEFNRECIMEYCSGPEGNLTMTVNGELNTKFDKYVPKDGDEIIIRYE